MVSNLGQRGEVVKTGPFGAILKSKEFVSVGVPVLAVGNVQSGRLDLKNARLDHVTEKKAAELSAYCVCAGDVLFTRSGTIGRSAVVPCSAEGWLMSYHILRVRADQQLVDPRYLYLVFSGCPTSRQYTNESAIGTTRPGINTQVLESLPIPLPPRIEQERIVTEFERLKSHVNSANDHLAKVSTTLKAFRQAVLAAACSGRLTTEWRDSHPQLESASALLSRIAGLRTSKGEHKNKGKNDGDSGLNNFDLPDCPDSWEWATIQQVAEVRGGIQKQPKRTPRKNSFPYLRVANVLRDKLDLSEIYRMELFEGELETYQLERGDLLIVEGNGSLNEIGRSAVWTGAIEHCVHQNHIIRVRACLCSPDYLNIYWNSPVGRANVAQVAVTTSGLYSLSTAKVATLPVVIPSLEEQREIVRRVEALFALAVPIQRHLATATTQAERLTQAILAKAFKGELVPTEAALARREGRSFESAAALLARIRAAGAASSNNCAPSKQGKRRAK